MGAVTSTVNLAGAEVEEQRDDDNAIGRRSPERGSQDVGAKSRRRAVDYLM
jgi:hypothetical protein